MKEAYLKAIGTDSRVDSSRMSFTFDDARESFHFERVDDADAARWQFHQLEIGAEHVLALAVLPRGGDCRGSK